jgi:hypothetical protein
MSVKPCIDCKKKKFGCYCKAYSAWLQDESLPEPILDKKIKIKKQFTFGKLEEAEND